MDTAPASASTSASNNVQNQEAQNGILAMDNDTDGPSATIHIHIDLDSDAGMRQARDALSAVFGPVVAAAPQAAATAAQSAAPAQAQVFAGAAAAPAQVFAGAAAAPAQVFAAPAQVFAPAAPQAAFQMPQSSYGSPASADIASTLQHLLQQSTPGRRRGPGRPSRAETELRQLMQAVAGTSGGATLPQAQAPHRNPCKICNQPKADCVLRNCSHRVCRACVVPYVQQFRAVCPILNCGQPASLTDIIPLTN